MMIVLMGVSRGEVDDSTGFLVQRHAGIQIRRGDRAGFRRFVRIGGRRAQGGPEIAPAPFALRRLLATIVADASGRDRGDAFDARVQGSTSGRLEHAVEPV
ncbi:MAG: hypothetical protein FJ299_01515 [Planctomycetes bacterium]|nr:hypothetical protein [Planctomycetota bacterium]